MGELDPGRAAVIALPRARSDLHLAQEGVHLGDGKHTPGADRAVAGESCGDMIELVAQKQRAAKLGDLRGKVGEQAGNVGLAERRGDGADQHRARAEAFDVEAKVGKLACSAFKSVAVGFVELDHFRQQQRLPRDRPTFPRRAHPLEHQPLVRGMLVDDDESVFGFGNDIGRVDLAAGDAERVAGDGFAKAGACLPSNGEEEGGSPLSRG